MHLLRIMDPTVESFRCSLQSDSQRPDLLQLAGNPQFNELWESWNKQGKKQKQLRLNSRLPLATFPLKEKWLLFGDSALFFFFLRETPRWLINGN